MKVIGYDKDSGEPLFSPESGQPSGMYNIYSRTSGGSNVFNNAVVGIDPSTGNFTGYSPQIYQDTRGSGGGGFGPIGGFLGGALNTILSDAKSMAKETANVWVPAVTAGLLSGTEGALSGAGAGADVGGILTPPPAGIDSLIGAGAGADVGGILTPSPAGIETLVGEIS